MLKHSFIAAALLTTTLVFSGSASAQDASLADEIKELSEEEQMELIMGTGTSVRLFNFETQEWDVIARVDHLDEESFKQYLPPIPEVKEMYDLQIEEGVHPYDAYLHSMIELEKAMTES